MVDTVTPQQLSCIASLSGFSPSSNALHLIQQQAAHAEALHHARLVHQFSKDSNHFIEGAWQPQLEHNSTANLPQQLQNNNESMFESIRNKMMNSVSRMTTVPPNSVIPNHQVFHFFFFSFHIYIFKWTYSKLLY